MALHSPKADSDGNLKLDAAMIAFLVAHAQTAHATTTRTEDAQQDRTARIVVLQLAIVAGRTAGSATDATAVVVVDDHHLRLIVNNCRWRLDGNHRSHCRLLDHRLLWVHITCICI